MEPALPKTDWASTLHDLNTNGFLRAFGERPLPLDEEQIELIYSVLDDLNSQFEEARKTLNTSYEALRNLERIITKTVNEKNFNTEENPQLEKTIALCHEIFTKVNSVKPHSLDSSILQLKNPSEKGVKELDAELIEFSDRLINNPVLTESIPESDVEALVITPKSVFDSKCQTLLFTNFKKRAENFSTPLPYRLITNLNAIIEFLTDFENERAELLFAWSEKFSIVIPNSAKHEIAYSLCPDILAKFLASGQLRKGEYQLKNLYNLVSVLNGRIDDVIEIKKTDKDKGELINFLVFVHKFILTFPSGAQNALEMKKFILEFGKFVTAPNLFANDCCPIVQDVFNLTTKMVLKDGQVEHPLYELLVIRKLSPTIDVACAYQDKEQRSLYNLSKLDVTRNEYDDLCSFVRDEHNRVPDSPNVLQSYIRSRYLVIESMQAGYQLQILKKMRTGELELSESLTSDDLEFTPVFSKELMMGLLDLFDKNRIDSTNIEKMFDIYQFCIHLANLCSSLDFFVSGMLAHFLSLIIELKAAYKRGDVGEEDYPKILEEIRTLLALVNLNGLDLAKLVALYKISTEMGITPPLVSLDTLTNDIYATFMSEIEPELLVYISQNVLGVHPHLEEICLQKIIKKLCGYSVYYSHSNTGDDLKLLTIGYQLAESTNTERMFIEEIINRIPVILERALYSLDLQKLSDIIKMILKSYPNHRGIELDLQNQRPNMAQIRMLAGIPLQTLKFKNANWFAHTRLHRNDRKEIDKLFPMTKIVWL